MNKILIAIVIATLAGCVRNEERPLPQQCTYADKRDFLRARVEYYTTAWVREHPDKPYHYTPAVPLVAVTNGVWGMETGPAVVAGHGLFVTVDDEGNLIAIKEIFNPD